MKSSRVSAHSKHKLYTICLCIIIAVTILINLISWNSRAFSDWYRENIFILWGPLYGTVTGITDRSVGEIMLGVATVLILLFIIAIIILTAGRISHRRVSCYRHPL